MAPTVVEQSSATEEKDKKNNGFDLPSAPVNKLTKNALAGLHASAKISGPGSVVVSAALSFKSANGMTKMNCEPCGFILVGNWSQHKKNKHGSVYVPSVKCTGEECLCSSGKYFEILKIDPLDRSP